MDKNTRVKYGHMTNFGLKNRNWEDSEDNFLFLSVVRDFLVYNAKYEIPYERDIEEVKRYVKEAQDESAFLKGCVLFDAISEKINIDSGTLNDWIKKNANSVSLASNYLNNLDLVIKELNLSQNNIIGHIDESVDNDDKSNVEKVDVEIVDDKKPNQYDSHGSIMLRFEQGDVQCNLLKTNEDATHEVRLLNGITGNVNSNEFYSMNKIDMIIKPAADRITFEWQQSQDPTKDNLIKKIMGGFNNKLGVLTFKAIDPQTFDGLLTLPSGDKIPFLVDKGSRIQKNENKFLINLYGKNYVISVNEKDFLNNVAKGELQQEYLEKIDLYGDNIKLLATKINLLNVPKNMMDGIASSIIASKDAQDRIFKNANEYFTIDVIASKDKFRIDSPLCKILFDNTQQPIIEETEVA